MADIIPFHSLKVKMIKQINDAERNADFEKMYQLFNVYEQHFDLNEEIALKEMPDAFTIECLFRVTRRGNYFVKTWIQLL